MKKTVLVVEDEERLNEIICDNLEAEGYKVLSAYDGEQAISIYEENKIDLVILDIMIPKIDGWSVCRRFRKKSDIIIVILSARSREDDKLLGYELGADDYVCKPFSSKVLMAKVKALISRFNKDTRSINLIEKGVITVDTEAYVVKVNDKVINLTAKEYELLIALMESDKKVMDRNKLINVVWGYDYFGDGRVVDTKIKTLRKKLGSYSKYIQTVIGIGYKFEVKK